MTDVLNPEILADYEVGREVNLTDLSQLSWQLRDFLTHYEEKLPVYEKELQRVNKDFSTHEFLKNLLV